ncbi:hypothetical protein ACPEIF_28215 [Streptomyces sp. NPDC012600]|uniref:Integral membrane protein n=2 Tax=Streptomycetaceae TaxID=2062 RepID=A0ABU2W3S4_9ACTN|nr:hypothetical protein [Streptomyces griseus]ARF73505.1 hypothetical protein B7C62_15465 [Kitasatospora albolonga]MDT0492516.1 hypothetical protein [Streptomyces griseus]
MDTRREALTDTAGCAAAVLGALAGIALWLPYGRRGLSGGFEGETAPGVFLLGVPVMVLGGATAALALFALVRGRWRPALGLLAALAGIAALGYGCDALSGPQSLEDCGPPC